MSAPNFFIFVATLAGLVVLVLVALAISIGLLRVIWWLVSVKFKGDL